MSDAAALVLTAGEVLTMDAARPRATHVVVAAGRIAAVGGPEVAARVPGATTVDLGGRTLAPGFIDAHNHLSISALTPAAGDASGVRDPAELVAVLRAHAAAHPDHAWLRLVGWEEEHFGFPVDRHLLDAGAGDRPAVLVHYSLHQCVASSAALDRLGIGAGTPDPPGGEIGRAADGTPTGLLVERAWSAAHAASLAPYADRDRWADHIADRAQLLLRDGITAVHDAACSPEAESVYRAMARAGTLPISVLGMPHPAAILTNDPTGRLAGPPTGEGDERFRVGPLKLFADGGVAIALDTAVGGRPVRYGVLMDDLGDAAARGAARGFDLAVHAIGNAGVAHALDVLESVRVSSDRRLRVEHATVTGPAEWRRLAALDAIAVVQPGFVEHVGVQSGAVRFDDVHWLAFAGLAEAGVLLAGSSDDPCAPAAPLWCMARGVDRTTSTGIAFEPEQSVPFTDWLHAYTLGAAVAGSQQDERGRIVPGARADFVVLDTAGAAPCVQATWVGGVEVFRADDASVASGP